MGGQYQESQEALHPRLAAWSAAGLAQEEPGPSRGITQLWGDVASTSAAADHPEDDGVGGLQCEDSGGESSEVVSESCKHGPAMQQAVNSFHFMCCRAKMCASGPFDSVMLSLGGSPDTEYLDF